MGDQNAKIIANRGYFHSLPVRCGSDLEHGAIWYLYGSILTILIPIFPLISIFENHAFWENDSIVPFVAHAVVYCLLIWIGICYSVGSALFIRTVRQDTEPLFLWKHIATDELHAMWWFYFGTLPTVPICAVYVFFNKYSAQYWIAFVVSFIATIVVHFGVFMTYPSGEDEGRAPITGSSVIAPLFQKYICCCSSFHRHMSNDWLLVSWIFLIGSLFAMVMEFGMFIHACRESDNRSMFDYSTGFVDMLLFAIGSAYFVAGSYDKEEPKKSRGEVEA